ncbi:MAG TPA: YdcF family protein [Candidatus Saccharimonadales bacterium]|nr:YdcF family protein [Candidatus Saccharimonadales bacterium]
MKMILIFIVGFIAVIVGLSFYLAPNDLADCQARPGDTPPCQTADAIVAVSGGDTPARAREAIKLYHAGWAPKLIFSGAAQDKSGPSNAEAMLRTALEAGVPKADIITENYSETTKQNAEKTHNIFEQHNLSSVILVTSSYHQRRASLEFHKRVAGTVAVRNHPVAADNQWSNLWWLTPVGWYLAFSESAKIVIFYLGGTK